ncbi:PLD nuclease N-terminal domain-containing protein [Microbacterium sp. SSM24]|uniref:PLD nuclease N-terminal domain-containing protein n=1 Tax=Microbacterium sp. SSM24 TaxID=2991714 RepID=UPI0022280A2E|nr:PLD nuclease N-terminal domain-containing protein [Microbacterium sp. SSM24]MCW3493554.1 PLD nuclease N-terminal domain-containing protein [Microbacterium sp. SSM24]
MTRALLILALVATAFWVYTIVDCVVQPPTRHRGVNKPVWILIVVLIPVLGGLLWLVVGRTRRAALAARRAPDDDPEFLGSLGAISDQDERIRRLEEELAQLDAEGDDPRWSTDPPAAASDAAGTAAPAAPSSAAPDAPADPPVRPNEGDDERGQRGAVG